MSELNNKCEDCEILCNREEIEMIPSDESSISFLGTTISAILGVWRAVMIKNHSLSEIEDVKNNIDWSQMDRGKSEFIYEEAKSFHQEITDSLNVMNDKSFQLIALTLPILTIIISYLTVNWGALENNVLISGFIFSLFLLMSLKALITAIWPRSISFYSAEPLSYFSTDYYKENYIDIIQGNTLLAFDNIEINHKTQKIREKWLKHGLRLLFLSPVSAIFTFFIIELFFLP